MRAEAILMVTLVTVAATVGALILVRRLVARARFNRIIARFERDMASPPWPPAAHGEGADERAAGRNE
jgi:hypothetical protein